MVVIDVVIKFYIMGEWEVVGFVVEGRWLSIGMVRRKWLGCGKLFRGKVVYRGKVMERRKVGGVLGLASTR